MATGRRFRQVVAATIILFVATTVYADDAAQANRDSKRFARARPEKFGTPQSSSRVAHPPDRPHGNPTDPNRQDDRRADGTWREEGRYLIIQLNGQEFRLAKSESESQAEPTTNQPRPSVGKVSGRLAHRGRPSAKCEVVLVPLRKSWTGYRINNAVEPLNAITDGNGVYRFGNVSPGPYKLQWRPAGQTAWIRRIRTRPDVNVQVGKTSHVKEIRASLRTIN